MEVIKGLFGKAQEVAEVVIPQNKDDGYSRDISTCPGTSLTLLRGRADCQATPLQAAKRPNMARLPS